MISEKTALIIPCHNEAEGIRSLLNDLLSLNSAYYPVVVDDASGDRTVEEVESVISLSRVDGEASRITLLKLSVNLGIGGAVQVGLRFVKEAGFKYAVKVDGDGQHPAREIIKLLEPLQKNEADFVIGSRFLTMDDGFKSTATRRIGIWIFRWLNSLLIGQKITDNTSGFRAYNRNALEFLAEHYPAFDYPEPEEVVLMGRNGFRLKEVPVLMQERQGGVSSINLRRSVYYMCKVTFAVLMAALRPAERKN